MMRAMNADDVLERLRVLCARVGFDIDKARGSLLERMRLLAECSETCDDAWRIATYADEIFRSYATTSPTQSFTAVEERTVILGCLFSDVGKTGPEEANADDRRLIVEAFAVENVPDDKQPIDTFLRTYFPDDAEHRIARFAALGIASSVLVRQFWNRHASWTLAIVEAAGLPLEAVAAAATHHLLENINPAAIVGADDRYTRRFGENACFDRAEKLVIILDKYDAARRRGRQTHDEAIAWLRERIAKNLRFHDDAEFLTLLADVDVVLGRSS